tara:strand:+ start:251 stop:379 length:129 start_codon:yes stop_codon:yes gene_type:complete
MIDWHRGIRVGIGFQLRDLIRCEQLIQDGHINDYVELLISAI